MYKQTIKLRNRFLQRKYFMNGTSNGYIYGFTLPVFQKCYKLG